jgi:hypothetical protein
MAKKWSAISRKRVARELKEWSFYVTCEPCGTQFSWKGKAKTTMRYVCKICSLPMRVENRRNENEES